MNDQRKVIYEQRKELLTTKNINQIFIDMLYETLSSIVEKNINEKEEDEINIENVNKDIKNIFGIEIANKPFQNKNNFLDNLRKNISAKLGKKLILLEKKTLQIYKGKF